jgi:serine/threonine-protein kinase
MVIGRKFALLEQLAKGGMGCVFRATDTRLNRQVAIKLVLPQYAREPNVMRRFLREAQATAAVRHPNVVAVLEMGERSDGSYFIVQELLEGSSLRDELDRKRKLSLDHALEILLPIMSALDAAHRIGIVHRDVKPENIVLACSDDGIRVPKLIDFGVAKAPRLSKALPTRDGEQLGTPAYMSP